MHSLQATVFGPCKDLVVFTCQGAMWLVFMVLGGFIRGGPCGLVVSLLDVDVDVSSFSTLLVLSSI